MDELILARWQFGLTSTYHFFFVPLTMGLSILVALMEVIYVRTGNELYKRMTKFWGSLFLINFAMGIVTGIVQEFHFGMNWSEYSRFMGDIFGAPLAFEALTAFFLEATFIGVWVFGWDKISAKLHALSICLVAFATNLSAFWILAANSFMQHPVGYALQNGRAEMTDFAALLTNPYVLRQYPHAFMAGLVTAGVFVAAVSAWHLRRKNEVEFFRASAKIGLTVLLGAALLVGGTGHLQAQYLAKAQPMKLASLEALWETQDPAPFSLFAAIDEEKQENSLEISVPAVLTFMVHDSFSGEVKGIKDLQQESVAKYGPGDYIPPVTPIFWSFRIMCAFGGMLILLGLLGMWLSLKNKLTEANCFLTLLLWSLPLPYLANTAGWFVSEAGRQPWLVVGLQTAAQGISVNVTAGEIWLSMIGFTVIYLTLAGIAVYLATKQIAKGPGNTTKSEAEEATLWN
ncbi:MAG: cytochrome ubiquinol oxidase subunit I [Sporomusaceae bacterium]|jgi:cytochrome d ubiquinol oxidase subunit I|nr:cytochrome ubiquinol oxidase subunit I [Sporomusaceae bacterium]